MLKYMSVTNPSQYIKEILRRINDKTKYSLEAKTFDLTVA